jgi:hypothetical protein
MSGEARWTVAEAMLLRMAAMVQLAFMVMGLVAPASLLGAWSLPFAEPATFLRYTLLCYGALAVGLLRASRLPRSDGRLLVEVAGTLKLGFVCVLAVDILARKLPSSAAVGAILDLIFGIALHRMGRRAAPQANA